MLRTVNWRSFWRKWHRWAAVAVAVPFLIVVVTGVLLQLKKQVPWVQPPTQRGQGKAPVLPFAELLARLKAIPEAETREWKDIDRIDVQPGRGLIKVTCKNRWEVQLDAENGAVLHSAYRRSDLIESLHDGSWFHEAAKLWIFLPSGILVLSLWLTGIYLFALPWWVKWRRPKAAEAGRA